MNRFISKYFIYIPLQYVRGERVMHEIKTLKNTEKLSYEELAKFQWDSLKRILEFSFNNIPYYKQKFYEHNLTPNMIKTPEDFLKFPTLNKSDLNKYNKLLIANGAKYKFELKLTSGSTGKPVEIFKDRRTQARARGAMFRNYSWYGIDIADRQARFTGSPLDQKARFKDSLKNFLANRIKMNVFDFSNDQIITFYKKIIRFKPKYIYGYPSAIFTFFDKLLKIKSYDISKIKLNAIITTGEVLHSYQRTFLEEILNCPVVNEYGSCETGPITFECKNRNIHLMADNLYIEIINNGRVAKANETGETIITELFNYVNPLIRYKLGDRIKLKEILNYNCPCGRNLPVIEKVKGRTSEIVKLPNDKIIHSEIFDYISDKLLESNGGIKQYKVTQQNIGEFHYDIVPSRHFSDKTLDLLRTLIQEYLGSDTHLSVDLVENIPVTESGKLRYFESKI